MTSTTLPATAANSTAPSTAFAARGKWTAFYLSLVIPGCGQCFGRSWTCLPWFIASGLVLALLAGIEPLLGLAAAPVRMAVMIVFGLASAYHALRLLEPGSPSNPAAWRATERNRMTVSCGATSGRRIVMRIELSIARSVEDAWRRVSDPQRFLVIDPFHDRVVVMRKSPGAGVDVALRHNAFGFRCWRFGRILSWSEGRGYAFSDLSANGPRHGFPHVFFVALERGGVDATGCRLVVTVRGKWTSRWIPTVMGRWWVRHVCLHHGRLLKKVM